MEQVFSIGSTTAMISWILLAASPLAGRWTLRVRQITSYVVPALLSLAYLVLIAWGWFEAEGGYGSIDALRTLFANDAVLVAGWLHFLAFDLFVGGWIVREGARRRVPYLAVLVCLPFTFLFGPVGYLLFLGVRAVFGKPAATHGDTIAGV